MKSTKWLQGILVALSIYTAGIGTLFLLGPQTAESLMGIELPDPVLTPLYGQVLLSIVVLAMLIASDPARYGRLVWGLAIHEAAHLTLFAYFLTSGKQTFQQVGPAMVINGIFFVVLVALQGHHIRGPKTDPTRQFA